MDEVEVLIDNQATPTKVYTLVPLLKTLECDSDAVVFDREETETPDLPLVVDESLALRIVLDLGAPDIPWFSPDLSGISEVNLEPPNASSEMLTHLKSRSGTLNWMHIFQMPPYKVDDPGTPATIAIKIFASVIHI